MSRVIESKKVLVYKDEKGKEPFSDWLNSLRDKSGKKRIESRIARLMQGNYGDFRSLGDGVAELRMFFGPGYRVYFGEVGQTIVILLYAGDKNSQENDIKTAKAYWKEYLKNVGL